MPSHAGDGAAESCRRRGDLATVRCRCRVMLATLLSSHVGDSAIGETGPQRDVDVESCWLRCCGVKLATALLGQLGRGAI
jgi:hypothetical protein